METNIIPFPSKDGIGGTDAIKNDFRNMQECWDGDFAKARSEAVQKICDMATFGERKLPAKDLRALIQEWRLRALTRGETLAHAKIALKAPASQSFGEVTIGGDLFEQLSNCAKIVWEAK